MKKKLALALSALFVGTCILPVVAACGGDETRDPETDPLVMSIQPVEMLFSPFFSTAGTDSSVVGMTQTAMLSADRDGNIAFGDEEPCVVKDYSLRYLDASKNPAATGTDAAHRKGCPLQPLHVSRSRLHRFEHHLLDGHRRPHRVPLPRPYLG